jgi:HEAT repeat protein
LTADPSGVGVLTTNHDLVIRTWNRWLASATSLAEDQVRGRVLTDVIDGPAAAWSRELFEEVLEGGTPRVLAPAFHRYLIACPPRVASPHFAHMQQRVTVAPLHDGSSIVGLIVTIEDVTERLHEERLLAARLQQDAPRRAALQAVGADDWKLRRAAIETLRRSASREDLADLIESVQRDHQNLNLLSSALQVLMAADVDIIEPLLALLADPDANLRMHAALALGALRSRVAVPQLIGTLGDADANVAFHAIEALGLIGAGESIDPLTRIAAGDDFFLAFAAVDALARIDDPRIAARLVGLLERSELRPAVVDLLARLGDDECVLPLVGLLNDGRGEAAAIAAALESIHTRYEDSYGAGIHIADLVHRLLDAAGVEALAAALARRATPLRPLVVVLGWVGSAAIVPLVATLGETEVQASLAAALMGIGRAVVGALLPRLDEGGRQERLVVAALLGRLGDRRAVPALRSLLDGADVELICTAAGALAMLGDAAALESLLPLLGHPVAAVRQAAIAAINSIGHESTAARIAALLADPDPRLRESAIRIAGYFGFESTVAAVFAAAEDDDPDVRRAAIEQLPVLDHPGAVARLVAALAREVPRNRAAAAHALRAVEDRQTIWPLRAALADSDSWVRYFAADSLGRRRSVEAVPALLHAATSDAATHVRIAALNALGAVDAPDLVDVTTALLREGDPDVAAAALTALGGVSDERVDDILETAATAARIESRIPAAQALGRRATLRAADALGIAARLGEPPELKAVAVESLHRIAGGASPGAAAAAVRTLLELAGESGGHDGLLTAIAALPPGTIDAIGAGLDSPSAGIRAAAAAVLGQMRHPRASERLARGLADPSPLVRDTTVAAFGRLGSAMVSGQLAEIAESDADVNVRRRAEAVCRRHGWIKGPAPR